MSNRTVETNNVITLLEEMTPLFVYIYSCIYHKQGIHETRIIDIELQFTLTTLSFTDSLIFDRYHYDAPIKAIKYNINELKAF